MLPLRGTWVRLRGALAGAGALASLALVAALLAVGAVAAAGAWSAVGRAFPGLLIDPYADFSVVSLPAWHIDRDLRWPYRLIAIDGRPLSRAAAYPGRTAAEEIQRLDAEGRTEVTLTFEAPDGTTRAHPRPILHLGATEVGFFFGFYAVAALFFLWTGGMVLVLSSRRAGARAYALFSVGAYLTFISFFDYHTTCRVAFAFSLGGVAFYLGFLWLAYAFPSRPRRLQRTAKGAVVAATAAGVVGAIWILGAPLLHLPAKPVREAVALALPFSMVVLALSILLRLRQARGTERAELLSAIWGLIATPVALAGGFALLVLAGRADIHLLLPFAGPLLPLSIGVALVRHNILNTSALLSRRLLVGPVALASTGAGVLAWLALRPLLKDDLSAWWPVALSAPAAVGAFVALSRLSNWMLFRAAAQFRPTLEQLSDQLSSVHELQAIRKAIEVTVARWLPISAPVRVLEARELDALSGLGEAALERLRAGEHLWLSGAARGSPLLIPMRSLGQLRGSILLPPKKEDALYTTEDFTLLATIASLGAVAFHHANTLIELELLRRTQVEATRDEKRFALGLVGAELSHEIAYPLNFFRFLLKRCARGDLLEAQDLEIGSEEVARLERMLDAMKKLGSSSPVLTRVQVPVQLRHALELVREQVEQKALTVKLEVPESLHLKADADMVLQIFANLLRNSAQAVAEGGNIGVRVTLTADGVQLECWDDGPGVKEWLRDKIWNPWVTTTAGGTGLGLAITQRLVQKLGWRIALEPRTPRTAFCIYVPREAICEPPPRSSPPGLGAGALPASP